LLHLLPESFKHIDAELLIQWQPSLQKNDVSINQQDHQVLKTFAEAHRGYEVSLPAIYRLVSQCYFSNLFQNLNQQQQALVIKRVLQRQDGEVVCEVLGLSGKRHLSTSLRKTIGQLLSLIDEAKV